MIYFNYSIINNQGKGSIHTPIVMTIRAVEQLILICPRFFGVSINDWMEMLE